MFSTPPLTQKLNPTRLIFTGGTGNCCRPVGASASAEDGWGATAPPCGRALKDRLREDEERRVLLLIWLVLRG